MKNNYCDVTTRKQAELSPLQKMYFELEKIIEPRLLDDYCGYNEETQSFDIVLATKEIIEAKEQECESQKQSLEYYIEKTTQLLDDIDNKDRFNTELQEENEKQKARIKELLHDCNSCKFYEYRQALDEIEKIARENDIYKSDFGNCGYKNITSNILDIISKGKE